MNEYYLKCKHFQAHLKNYTNTIFNTYGKQLILRLEEFNLLSNKNNCIESSTTLGYILEEFILSKLELYTLCDNSEYIIKRIQQSSGKKSYDAYSVSNNIQLLINVKAEKLGNQNSAVAAIGNLYKDYCINHNDNCSVKSYVVLKIIYSINGNYIDTSFGTGIGKYIKINDIITYNIEEIDFSKGHMQDHRSWSNKPINQNNGRLLISNKFLEEHRLSEESISYQNTLSQLELLVSNNY